MGGGERAVERRQAVATTCAARAAPIHALTGLRFAAALLVFVSHLPMIVPVPALEVGLEQQGAAGVTIFFVLSGFVLTYRYLPEAGMPAPHATGFMRARLARIVPMHLVALVLTTAVVLLWTSDRPSVVSWIVNASMLHAFVPAQAMHLWNIPSWSVSAELAFYAVFPLLLASVLVRLRRRRSVLTLAGATIAAEVVLFCAAAVLIDRRMAGEDPTSVTALLDRVKFFPGLRVGEFFLGCLLGWAFLHSAAVPGPWSRLAARRTRDALVVVVLVGLAALMLAATLVDSDAGGLPSHLLGPGLYLWYTPLAVLLVAALAWGPTMATPVLERPWSRRLGDASYSFYLLQWPLIIVITNSEWLPSPPTWWTAVAALAVLLVASLACARWIEAPARGMIRGGESPGSRLRSSPYGVSAQPDTTT